MTHFDSQFCGINLRPGIQILWMTLLAGGLHIRKRRHHPGMSGSLIGGLLIARMTDIAKIAKSM